MDEAGGDGVAAGRARGRGGRADDRHRGARHRGRLPRARALARCRWCAASGCCSWSASRSRSAARLTAGAAALRARRGAPARRRLGRSAARPRAAARAELVGLPPGGRATPPRGVRGRRRAAPCALAARAGPGGCSRVGLAVARRRLGGSTRRPRVESDLTKLVPQNLPRAAPTCARCRTPTGVAGEIDVVVRADDITDPAVVQLDASYQQRVLRRFGYAEKRGCGAADAVPGVLAARPVRLGQAPAQAAARSRRLLDAGAAVLLAGVITPDRREATLAFGIRLDAARPPAGDPADDGRRACTRRRACSARLAGLPVLAAEANAALSDPWRRLGTLLAGLLARRARAARGLPAAAERALVPLVPIALATGWSALVRRPRSR